MSATELIKVGLKASLGSASVQNGTWKFASDTKELYFEYGDARHHISDVVTGMTSTQILGLASSEALPKIYLGSDNDTMYWYGSNGWAVVGGDSVAYASSATADGNGNVIDQTYETAAHASSMVSYLEALIGDINSFEVQKVASTADLPDHDQNSHTIYFVPNTKAGSNVYDEYIWVVDTVEPRTGHYENIGSSALNFDNYYTKDETDAKFATTETAEAHASSISALETAVGASSVSESILGRLAGIDQSITDLENADTYADSRITDLENGSTVLDSRVDTLEEQMNGTGGLGSTSVLDRLSAAEQLLDATTADVATINRYNIVEVAELPATGDKYTIYNVPEADGGTTGDNYAQWIYVEAFTYGEGEDETTIPAGWQRIDSSSAFSNYYTKNESDAKFATTATAADIDGKVTEINNKLGAMSASTASGFKSVEERLTTLENAATSDDSRLDTLETQVNGEEGSTATSILGRLDTAEADITDIENAATALEARVGANEGAIEVIDGDINGLVGGSTATSIKGRLDSAESRLTDLENADTATDSRLDDIENAATALEARVTAAEGDIDDIEEAISGPEGGSSATSILGRLDTAEADITALENAGTALDGRVAALELSVEGTGAASTATSVKGRLDTVEATIGTPTTVSGTIFARIENLETDVAGINRFNIRIVDELPEVGEQFILYFVEDPDYESQSGLTRYFEYMWIEDPTVQPDGGYYEQIGITEANMENYYTKAETDAKFATTADLTNASTEIDARLDDIEEAIGASSVAESILGRLDGIDGSISDIENAATALAARVTANEGSITDIENAATALAARVTANEGSITDIENAATALAERVSTNENDISDLKDADTALDSRLDVLEAHDFLYAGSTIEGGAANGVVESASTASAEQEVLLANDGKDAVQYASSVTVNPATGVLTAQGIKLGDCVLAYDDNEKAVVFNYS